MSTEAALAPDWPIETERLRLRPIDPVGDIDAMHAYLSREDVCAYIPAVPSTREQVAEQYADPERRRSTLTAPKQAIRVAVVLKDSGALIGDAMLFWRSAEHRSGEVGYVFHPDHHGRGYATEAVRVLLRLGFEGLGLHRIVGRIDQRNPASAAVLTKVGMRQEAILVDNEWFKGQWSTEVDFAMLASEWRAHARPSVSEDAGSSGTEGAVSGRRPAPPAPRPRARAGGPAACPSGARGTPAPR